MGRRPGHHPVDVVSSAYVVVEKLTQTCEACPSQWEGQLRNGECFYGRYRWGVLSIGFGGSSHLAVVNAQYHATLGDGLDGVLSTEDFLPHLMRAVIGHVGDPNEDEVQT